jgi:hypothetical protein
LLLEPICSPLSNLFELLLFGPKVSGNLVEVLSTLMALANQLLLQLLCLEFGVGGLPPTFTNIHQHPAASSRIKRSA